LSWLYAIKGVIDMQWIELNLPYSGYEYQYTEEPDLSQEMIEEFKTTPDMILDSYSKNISDVLDDYLLFGKHKTYQNIEEWHDKENVQLSLDKLKQDLELITTIYVWKDSHPKMLDYKTRSNTLEEEYERKIKETFQEKGLAQPGIQIELDDGKRYLIGHINRNRGVCDDCTQFSGSDIVVRYRRLVSEEDLK